jgi:hypothetical protein
MSTARAGTIRAARSPSQLVATIVALLFLAVGILGFIPGITAHYSDMTFAGHMSDAKLIGLFQVSVLHNVVHLLYGVVGLAMARSSANSVIYLIAGGVVYLVLWIYGLAIGMGSSANFVPVNTADNWLHFFLGVVMVGAGIALRRRASGSGV